MNSGIYCGCSPSAAMWTLTIAMLSRCCRLARGQLAVSGADESSSGGAERGAGE